jgi:excisionase family DNA binding protein
LFIEGTPIILDTDRILRKKSDTYEWKSFFFHSGIYIAEIKVRKNHDKGGKFMSLLDKDVVLTTKEATQYLKISKPTFLKYIRLGRIRAAKAGTGWRVHQSELHRFLNIRKKLEDEGLL